MEEVEYADKMILLLKQKYESEQLKQMLPEQEIGIGVQKYPLEEMTFLEGIFVMRLPQSFREMENIEARVRYMTADRPQVIMTDNHNEVSFTFSKIDSSGMKNTVMEEKNIERRLEMMQSKMKKVWKQNVFYEMDVTTGGNCRIAWMDYKGFCLNGMLYSLFFIFDAGDKMVLGNFQCDFPVYDIWKPAVMKLLNTISITV